MYKHIFGFNVNLVICRYIYISIFIYVLAEISHETRNVKAPGLSCKILNTMQFRYGLLPRKNCPTNYLLGSPGACIYGIILYCSLSLSYIFCICNTTKYFLIKNTKKLDQKTWLCQTKLIDCFSQNFD